MNSTEKSNRKAGKYCKGCVWRHIGINVGGHVIIMPIESWFLLGCKNEVIK